ncbi:MAG: peroxidase family protein [Nocardioidaceae bacterium]
MAGGVGIEQAAKAAGQDVIVPFTGGRVDASQDETDIESIGHLEPVADGFRNWIGKGNGLPGEYLLLDRANQLNLSAPEMTVLVGGLRVLGANTGGATAGVLTDRPGVLSNDFFVNILDIDTSWSAIGEGGPEADSASKAPPLKGRSGPAPAPIWSSAPTPSSAQWPRSTRVTMPKRSSPTTSSPLG